VAFNSKGGGKEGNLNHDSWPVTRKNPNRAPCRYKSRTLAHTSLIEVSTVIATVENRNPTNNNYNREMYLLGCKYHDGNPGRISIMHPF
jgi:hypothetical protein